MTKQQILKKAMKEKPFQIEELIPEGKSRNYIPVSVFELTAKVNECVRTLNWILGHFGIPKRDEQKRNKKDCKSN